MKLLLAERAQNDQDAIFDYLNARSPTGAVRVINAMERTFALICEHPEIGEATDRVGIRALAVSRFPYWVFYRPSVDLIQIIHIRHAARRPWAG